MTRETRACSVCENGYVVPINLRGRRFDYRDSPGLQFDEDLPIRSRISVGFKQSG